MDSLTASVVEECTTTEVSEVAKGLAGDILNKNIAILRKVLSVFKDCAHGVKFENIEKCSPEEVIAFCKRTNKTHDITKSTLVMVKITFSFRGTLLDPKFIYLPYTTEHWLMYISNSLYMIRPVLTDKIMSPNKTDVFIRLLRGKIRVTRLDHQININFKRTVTRHVLHACIHTKNQQIERITKAKPTLIHYLFVKYGLKDTFQRLLGIDIIPMTVNQAKKCDLDNYVVYTATGLPPRTVLIKERANFKTADVALVVKREDNTNLTSNMMVSVFYLLDHFTDMTVDDLHDKDIWKTLMGYTTFGRMNISSLNSRTDKHLKSLDRYVEQYMIDKLGEEFGNYLGQDFSKDGFFKILIVVLQRFHIWTVASEEISASCYDKRLEISYYILYSILVKINEFSFDLDNQSPDKLTLKSVKTKLDKNLTLGKIFSINKSNPACVPVMYSGDNMYYKITSSMELQLNVKSVSNNPGRATTTPDSTTLLHASHPVGGTLNAYTKSRLAPLRFVNLFCPYCPETNTIMPSDRTVKTLSRLDKVLSKTIRNSHVKEIPEEFDIYHNAKCNT